MTPAERDLIVKSISYKFAAWSGENNDHLVELVTENLRIDLMHLDAIAQLTEDSRPVLMHDIAEGIDVLVIKKGQLTEALDRYTEAVAHITSENAEVNKIGRQRLGEMIESQRLQHIANGGAELCVDWESLDGTRYLAFDISLRNKMLRQIGLSPLQIEEYMAGAELPNSPIDTKNYH